MEKTTITINGEECVILPAPKGAFLIKKEREYPYFVEYVAISTEDDSMPNIYGIYLNNNDTFVEVQDKQDGDELKFDVLSGMLKKLYQLAIEAEEEDIRGFVIEMYSEFISHGTPMDYTAIQWFREKFKEHNITKADFDVFA